MKVGKSDAPCVFALVGICAFTAELCHDQSYGHPAGSRNLWRGVSMERGGHAVCGNSWFDSGSVLLGRDTASIFKGPISSAKAMSRWG